jgi:Cu/Ag efflux pump CusA
MKEDEMRYDVRSSVDALLRSGSREAVTAGCERRLRPVLMTLLVLPVLYRRFEE